MNLNRTWILAGSVCAWLCFAGCGGSNGGEAGSIAPDYDGAALRAKAEAGDAAAQAAFGKMLANGDTGTNDYAQAAQWLSRAADQEHAEAQASLGELYEAGQGVPRDVAKAHELYRRAATNGSAAAQYNLGFIYESGRGVPQDHQLAARWFLKAAAQGEPLSQYDLGQRYLLGVGVEKDPVEGLKWLLLAAKQGQADALKKAEEIKSGLSREQVAEAQRRAAAFTKTSQMPGLTSP